MSKIITSAFSVALALSLSLIPTLSNTAQASGGCQNLSTPALEQKADPFNGSIHSASQKYGVSKDLIKAVITIESCFKPTARGTSGEKGLMQLMSGTARRFGVSNGYSAWQNIHGGARYLSYLLGHYQGNAKRAVAAYNAGEGNVGVGGKIPNAYYVNKVMHAYGKFSGNGRDALFVPAKAYQPGSPVLMKASLRMDGPIAAAPSPSRAGGVLPWGDMIAHAKHAVKGNAGSHTVQSGETVFEVMRQTGVPVKQIIRLNHLPAPYGIQAGQNLRLD